MINPARFAATLSRLDKPADTLRADFDRARQEMLQAFQAYAAAARTEAQTEIEGTTAAMWGVLDV